MHEYTLMQDVVASILERLKKPGAPTDGARIEVVLKVGALEVHSAEAARQAYEVLVRSTVLEQSKLNLLIEPVTLECPKCGFQGPLPKDAVDPHDASPLAECPACGAVSVVRGGRGVESIELVWEDAKD